MKTRAGWLLVLLASATASGCAYRASYEAQGGAPADETGPPVSTYPIPANDPAGAKGSVNVISMGTERLPVAAGQPDMFLHVRLAAENTSDGVSWTIDPNDQLVSSGGTSLQPSFAEASGGGPVLTLNSGGRGYLDVFYPAPPANSANRITINWRLQRGGETVAGATDLDRVAGPDPTYAYYQPVYGPNVYMGFGLGYWWWPDYYFWHHGPFWSPYPRYFGYYRGGYWGGYRGHLWGGGYRGPRYSSGRGWGSAGPSGGGWSSGGARVAPSGGGGGGGGSKSGWRGGGRR
jgi:hypothetical protein